VIDGSLSRLADLARSDPVVAPLATLQAEALRVSSDRGWNASVPPFALEQARNGLPLLHQQTVRVDHDRQRRLFRSLVDLAASGGQQEIERLRRSVERGAIEPLELLQASIRQDPEAIASLAMAADVDSGLLTTLGQLASIPLLQACGRSAAPILEGLQWEAGYCPVCAAWPTLAELRGLERRRWLHCGRCGTSWWCQECCSFCATTDQQLQGYLAPEANRESQRAQTCDSCQSYLKSITSLRPIAPTEVAIHDLMSLELDLAALEQGYSRPDRSGFPLEVTVESARRRMFRLPGWR
jgi:FdhE protein